MQNISALEKIILINIAEKKRIRPKELNKFNWISRTTLYKALNSLLENGFIVKTGKKPRIYYRLSPLGKNYRYRT